MKKVIPFYVLLTALLIAVYWQGLGAPYFSIDDRTLIEIPQISSGLQWTTFKTILTPGTHIDYYPIRDFSYLVDQTFWPHSLWGARVHQLLYFSLGATVLLLIALELGISFFWSSGLSFLWALHPYHAESILWLSGRKDVMALSFALLSTYFFIKTLKINRGAFLSLLFFCLSLCCKASFILLPFIPLAAVILKFDLFKKKKIVFLSLSSALIACLYSLGQTWFYSTLNPMHKIIPMLERLLSSLVALGRMLWGWFNPYANIVDIENLPPWYQYHLALLPLVFCFLTIVGMGVYWILKQKKYIYLLLPISFLLLYLPISGLVFPHQNFYSPRYFEPASIVFWLTLMLSFNHFKLKKIYIIPFVICALIFSFLSFKEGITWSSPLNVRKKAFQEVPESLSLKSQYFEELIYATKSQVENDKHYQEKNSLASALDEACAQKSLEELIECKTFYETAYYVHRYNGRLPEAEKYLKLYAKSLSTLKPAPLSVLRLRVEQKLLERKINEIDLKLWQSQVPALLNPQYRLLDITLQCLRGDKIKARRDYQKYKSKKLLTAEELKLFTDETLPSELTKELHTCIEI